MSKEMKKKPIDYFDNQFEDACANEFYHLPNYEDYANGDFDLIFDCYKENFVEGEEGEDEDMIPSVEDFIDYVIS